MSTLSPNQNHNREFDLIDNLIATLRARMNEPIMMPFFIPSSNLSYQEDNDDEMPDLVSDTNLHDLPELLSDIDEDDDPNNIQSFIHFTFNNGNDSRDYSSIIREMNTGFRETLKN
jgi:hypothetical protein